MNKPTDEQNAVINTDRTAVVAAGAGSGKTTVLAHRFVRLVLEKRTPVDTILTLTFTNKATNEMHQRIYTFLAAKREAARESGEDAEKTLLDEAITNFYKARIETLDSYCASIVRAASSRYGLAPDFSEDMERSAAIIEEESLPFVIKHRNHPAIMELYREKTPDVIARAVFAETISKHCFLGAPVDFVADFHAAAQKIAKDGGELTAEIQRIVQEIRDKQAALAEEIAKKKCGFLDIPEVPDLAVGESSRRDIVNAVKTLYDFAYTSLARNPGRMLKDEMNALRERFALFVPLAVFIVQKDTMEALCGLLNTFENIVFDRKRREGSLSYADVAALARRILLEDKELRREEKETFSSIIIDEFQDNNALQRDILYLLAEKHGAEQDGVPDENNIIDGKLFFVGDEKQSIYKFRGADVSVFRELQHRFPSGHFTLQTNFRSSHNLIGFFNAVFGGTNYSETKDKLPALFPAVFASAHTDDVPSYEAEYTPLQTSEAKKQVDGKAVVCLFPALGSRNKGDEDDEEDEAEHAETEAVFVAKKIRALKESGRYQYRDIAILVRSHTNEHFFEKHLRIQGIPYTNENLTASVSIDPVADLYALLRLVSYPTDRLAYAEVLRSPFVGLSFGGMLSALKAYDKAKEDPPTPFAETASLSEEDRKKFDNGRKLYLETKNRSINGSIQELIAYLWYAQGYRYEVLWHKETRAYYNGYHVLFALAVKADNAGSSLAPFTETLKTLLDRPRFFSGADRDKSWLDDLIVPFEKEDALSLMTIHKSKGLEFPVVFVCGCGDGRKKTESSFVMKNEDGSITVTPIFPLEFAGFDPKKVKKNYFRENAKDEENAKETAELRRLLYVAMTRAEEEIYLTGTLKYTKDDDDGENLKTLVKSVAERKREKEKPRIEGDTIIDNGSFLGLLLPMIAERMDEGLFDLEEIPAAGREDIYGSAVGGGVRVQGRRAETGGFGNDAKGRAAFIAQARAIYEKARIREEEKTYPRHQSVTYLKKCADKENAAGETAGRADPYGRYEKRDSLDGGDAADIFGKIDTLLAGGGLHAEFGTITHTCVEAALKGKPAFIPPFIGGKLDGGTAEQLLAAGEEIARRFLDSPLGTMARNAAWARSEFRFRTIIGRDERNTVARGDGGEPSTLFINGTIDLVFEKDGVVTIVDFKTDSAENPAEHAVQMAVYYWAARNLWQKETRVFLYYLRTGHAVEFLVR
ncbi:MAG: UvrD-helicase domain-containing protein [Spirochaetaceae bacterium]|jgi:ATP-dependent helicase/nuclease subunit A|nr:UvrD-helicase domain-containing protein [Spirochaetaceae bacterium]